MIEIQQIITEADCEANPDKLYVFGGNLAGSGFAGQACIRRQMNAFEIPTKRFPSTHHAAYFSDKECERQHVLNSLRDLYRHAKHRTIVFPASGVGTGMAKMKEKSPLIFAEMNAILLKHFGVTNA